MAYPL